MTGVYRQLCCCVLLAGLPLAGTAAQPAARVSSAAARQPGALEQARQNLRQGRISEAAEVLRAHLQMQPQDLEARRLLLQLLLDAAQFAEAEGLLAESLALFPGTPDLSRVLASLQARRGEFVPALVSLRNASSFGQHAEDLAFAGQLAAQAGMPQAAREHFEQALRLAPGQARWQVALAAVCLRLGDKARARALLESLPAGSLPDAGESLYARQLLAEARQAD